MKSSIDRRTLLRGAGAVLGLPLLEAMSSANPSSASQGPSKPPVRVAWVFFPNGTHASDWLTTAEGETWKVAPSLEP